MKYVDYNLIGIMKTRDKIQNSKIKKKLKIGAFYYDIIQKENFSDLGRHKDEDISITIEKNMIFEKKIETILHEVMHAGGYLEEDIVTPLAIFLFNGLYENGLLNIKKWKELLNEK